MTARYFDIKGGDEPGTPSSGYGRFYVKTLDGHLYYKDDAGNETDMSAAAGGGEANTASNVTASTGVGIFKQKSSVDLEFKSLLPGSNKLTISGGTSDVTIDVAPSNIPITGLSGYDANKYVDHTAVSISSGGALTGGGTIASNQTITLDVTSKTALSPADPAADYLLIYDTSASAYKKVLPNDLGLSLESTTASNVTGTTGVGIFKQLSGSDLQFKSLLPGSNKLSISGGTSDVTLDVVPSNIDITALANYSANKYVDHTSVSINVGTGLTGGGTIASTRTISLNTDNLTNTALADDDELCVRDTSGATYVKTQVNQLRHIDAAYCLQNVSFAFSTAGGAMTITMKGRDGSNLSATNPAKIGFRNLTDSTAQYSVVEVTSNLTLTVVSGATLGGAAINSVPEEFSIYACYNGSAVFLAVSKFGAFDESKVKDITLMDTASDSRLGIYGTALTGAAIRKIGVYKTYEATWGTWSTTPSAASVFSGMNWGVKSAYCSANRTSSQTISNNTLTIVDFANATTTVGINITTGSGWFAEVQQAGIYWVNSSVTLSSQTWGGGNQFSMYCYLNGSNNDIMYEEISRTYTGKRYFKGISMVRCEPGDRIDIRILQVSGSSQTTTTSALENFIKITRAFEGES